jgi:hypothetical protein
MRVSHASRLVTTLFDDVVVPRLEARNLKTYGVKSRLVDFIKAQDGRVFPSDEDFLTTFLDELAGQTRKVRGGKETPVLKQFSIASMSRPAWREQLKAALAVEAGDNIRHVVRNATLKRALVEHEKRAGDEKVARFVELANAVGIANPPRAYDQLAAAVYHAVYLNRDNLFAGGAAMNQVIGFAADPVRQYGEELLAQGEEEVAVLDVYKTVMARVYEAANKIKGNQAELEYTTHVIHETVRDAVGSLHPDPGQGRVPAEVAGDLVADIGLGFGFDFIDGRALEDQQALARRQGRLVWCERALGAYAGGATDPSLPLIFKVFMGFADPPQL